MVICRSVEMIFCVTVTGVCQIDRNGTVHTLCNTARTALGSSILTLPLTMVAMKFNPGQNFSQNGNQHLKLKLGI
jgi:hypothetical protein